MAAKIQVPIPGPKRDGFRYLYGINFDPRISDLEIALFMFRERLETTLKNPNATFVGNRGPEWFFKQIALMLWPEESTPDQPISFKWHPWAEKMIFEACRNPYLAIAGCSGLGKSEVMAIWPIINYIADPINTLCMVTSTTVASSKQRIWGKIIKYWFPLQKLGFPGKLIESLHVIRFMDANGESPFGDTSGITMVPAEKQQEKNAMGKLIGIHPVKLIFVADELSELSPAITEAVFYNLSRGCKQLQFTGISNPKSYFDTFGEFAKPKAGWASITVDDDEWETDRGKCIHFDSLKNPNIVSGQELYSWMDTQEDIDKEMEIHGGKSSNFWRMFRGFWSPSGVIDQIYTEVEIINSKADESAVWLDNQKTRVSFLDPSFTNGGDRTISFFGTFGTNTEGHKCLEFDPYIPEKMLFHEDITNKKFTRTQQCIMWWKQRCEEEGVLPIHAGYDATGAGGPFGDVVSLIWSPKVLGVNFGSKASDTAVSAYDPTPACERYVNRVTEIWFSAKEYIRSGQIKGISPELMQEMTWRTKEDDKGSVNLRIRITSKSKMKSETGKSCDIADAAFGVLDICRQRLDFDSGMAARKNNPNHPPSEGWKAQFQKFNSVYSTTPARYPL